MSVNILIADAVANQINDFGAADEYLAFPLFAERVWEWEYDSARETDLKIYVCPLEELIDLNGTREDADNTTQVVVAFYKKVSASDRLNKIDELVVLVGQIKGHLQTNYRLTDYPSAALIAVRWSPVFDPATLTVNNTFVSGLTLEYRWLGND